MVSREPMNRDATLPLGHGAALGAAALGSVSPLRHQLVFCWPP
jgi:hypothetical protein